MNKIITIATSVLTGSVLAVILLLPRIPVLAVTSGTASQNGDVNGDGTIDLSDAIYTLLFLFQGGDPPIPCGDSGEVTELRERLATCNAALESVTADLARTQAALTEAQAAVASCNTEAAACRASLAKRGLPVTGQSTCHDVNGDPVECQPGNCFAQNGLYQMGCPNEDRFIDNGDGTVADTCTGLIWQQDSHSDPVTNEISWCEAIEYCENLIHGGHEDWRLPNVRELQSIMDYGRAEPSLDPIFGAFSSGHWTSTSWASSSEYAWAVQDGRGEVSLTMKTFHGHVRAVRGP